MNSNRFEEILQNFDFVEIDEFTIFESDYYVHIRKDNDSWKLKSNIEEYESIYCKVKNTFLQDRNLILKTGNIDMQDSGYSFFEKGVFVEFTNGNRIRITIPDR